MKRRLGVIAWVVLSASCAAPSVPPVQEWTGPVRSEPVTTMARGLFDQVVDGTFSFDDEAFYWLCEHVRSGSARRELLAAASSSPTPIRQLLERPGDFRGQPVVVEGILRSREAYEIRARLELGRLTQLELSWPGTRAIITVVCTERPASSSAGAPVRATGYFLKSRQFRTADGQPGAGVVLVTNGMISSSPTSARVSSSREFSFELLRTEWLVTAIAVLVVVWLVLRRRMRSPAGARLAPREQDSARGKQETGDSDFAWMTTQDPQASERTAQHGKAGGDPKQ